MKTSAWSFALGISCSVGFAACSDDGSSTGGPSNTGGRASNTGGQASNGGGTGGANQAAGGTGGSMATGGSGGGNQATGSAPEPTAAAIAAFIAAGTYKQAPWISETAAPRAPISASPHGHVRVWFNDTIQASIAAGNGKSAQGGLAAEPPHTVGSMVVKELFDEGGTFLGVTVFLKVPGDGRTFAFYGEGPGKPVGNEHEGQAAPTYTAQAPFFAYAPEVFSSEAVCTYCHAGVLLGPTPTF